MSFHEPFCMSDSVIHQLDSRIRVIFAVIFSFFVALAEKFPVLGAALCLSIVFIIAARLNLKTVGKRLNVVLLFLLLMWLALPLTFDGEPLLVFGPLSLSRPGVMLAACISIKSITILLIFMGFIATMPLTTLGQSMHQLRVPEKLILLLLITYRYIFVIEEEYLRLRQAIKIRGFSSRTSLHAYKTYAYLIGMLFVRASLRGERVYQAMQCRGFTGRFHSLDIHVTSGQNKVFSVLMTGILLILIFLENNPL